MGRVGFLLPEAQETIQKIYEYAFSPLPVHLLLLSAM